jgi:transcriptional regulator with XRE-family HTH domain
MNYIALIGPRLKQERERSGLSQEEMAERANTNQALISLVENGNRTPTVGTLVNLASALNCTLFIDLVRDPRTQR